MSIPLVEGTLGLAVPPGPRHAVTVHLPTWQAVVDFLDRKPETMALLKTMYPRMMVHTDIKELTIRICQLVKVPEGKTCLLYPTLTDAQRQIDFSTDPRRGDLKLVGADLEIKSFDIDVRYYAVFFDMVNTPSVFPFWMHAGVGVTSRRAEESMKHIDKLREVALDRSPLPDPETPAMQVLQRRVADLLERVPVGGERSQKVQPNEVYFFQSGMAAIFWVNNYLTMSARSGAVAMYGYAFHHTPHALEYFSKSFKLFGRANTEDLDQLEQWLEEETKAGRPVQAIWAEFPANPMLSIPDIARLRQLTNKYGCFLIVDDTVGSFCNVDLMGDEGADIVVTSLSKSFSGYADLLMGSAALNPLSRSYDELKTLFVKHYTNDVCPADLEALEHNSRNYLERSIVLNNNAKVLVDFLATKARDPESSIDVVLYPSVHPQKADYDARMRSKTADFTPGYGCLFSVQFEDLPTTIAFYDELSKYLHISPHLGAHKTLALAYTKGIYGKELDSVTDFGLDEKAIRVSVGFEDEPERLLQIFKVAVGVADKVKSSASSKGHHPEIVATLN